MPAPEIDIQHVANLARLALTDEEAAHYQQQLNGILQFIDTLSAQDLEGAEPTAHAIPIFDVMRTDEPRPGFTQDQALANAPRKAMDQFQIPKVLE